MKDSLEVVIDDSSLFFDLGWYDRDFGIKIKDHNGKVKEIGLDAHQVAAVNYWLECHLIRLKNQGSCWKSAEGD